MTRGWVGEFTLPSGQRGAAYMNITHNSNKDFYRSRLQPDLTSLEGTGSSCYGASSVQNYTLSGGSNSAADDVEVGFGVIKPTVAGYALDVLKGAWDGGSALTLSGTFQHILDTKDTTESANEPNQRQPTKIVFHPGTQADFTSLCQKLGK